MLALEVERIRLSALSVCHPFLPIVIFVRRPCLHDTPITSTYHEISQAWEQVIF